MSFQRHEYGKKKAKKLVFLENSHRHQIIILNLGKMLHEMKIQRWPKDSLTSKTIFYISMYEQIF